MLVSFAFPFHQTLVGCFGNVWLGQFSLYCSPNHCRLVGEWGGLGARGSLPELFPHRAPPASSCQGFVTMTMWDSPSPLPGEPAQKEDADQQENAAGHCRQRSSSAKGPTGLGRRAGRGTPPEQGLPEEVSTGVSAFPPRMQLPP